MTVILAKTPRVTLVKRVNLNKRVRSPRVGSIVAVNLSGIRSDRLFTVVNVAEHNNSVMLADNVLDAEGKELARVRALTLFFAEGRAEEIEGYASVKLAPEGE